MSKRDLAVTGAILLVLFAIMATALSLNLKYVYAAPVSFLFAALLSPVAIHKVSEKSLSIGLLVALAMFASHPFRKLFQLDGFIEQIAVTVTFLGLFWIFGFGWKRNWR